MVKEVGPQIKEKAPLYFWSRSHICYPHVSDHIGTEIWRKWSYPLDWPDALVKIKAATKIQKQYRDHLYGNLSDGEEIDFKKIVFEGVKYLMDPGDGDVFDPDDYSMVGIWNADEKKIDFEEDCEDTHKSKRKEDYSWIISDKNLMKYEMEHNRYSPPIEFLKRLYKDEGYMQKIGGARGRNAKNWKTPDGKYVCVSLYKANNIYVSVMRDYRGGK